MTGDLLIYNTSTEAWEDMHTLYGAALGSGTIDALLAPAPLKAFVENSSRLEHGKHVVVDSVRLDSRDVTLSLVILGNTRADATAKREALYARLQRGAFSIRIPALGMDVYNLIYQSSVSYAQNYAGTAVKLAVKCTEANPNKRTL